jgi:hypothetical protein
VLNNAMTKMPGIAKFCTRMLYIKGEDVFGSQKRQPDMPIGNEQESHRPDGINFNCPQVEIRSSRIAGCSLTNI